MFEFVQFNENVVKEEMSSFMTMILFKSEDMYPIEQYGVMHHLPSININKPIDPMHEDM
jgi:hypothetical protein